MIILDWLTTQDEFHFLKVLSLLEACLNLISGSSLHMKIQIMGGKITENLGFKSPLRKVNLKMKRKKGQIFFDLPERGFEPQIFISFPAHDLNFHVK